MVFPHSNNPPVLGMTLNCSKDKDMKHYYVYLPGSFYAADYYGESEEDVAKQLEKWLGHEVPEDTVIEQAEQVYFPTDIDGVL